MKTSFDRFAIIKQKILPMLAAAVCGIGFAFRMRQFFFNRSFWVDEASLANAVLGSPLTKLLTQPLEHNQAAPLGFLSLVYLTKTFFGSSEFILRLIPFLFGIACLLIAIPVGRRAFSNAGARITFWGLVSFSPILIYYSTEFKPYILDAFFSLAIIFLFMDILIAPLDLGKTSVALLFGCLAVWFSFPSAFLLAAAGFLWFADAVRQGNRIRLARLLLIGTFWAGSFVLMIIFSAQSALSNTMLQNFWESAFLPITSDFGTIIAWTFQHLLGLTYFAFHPFTINSIKPQPSWFQIDNLFFLFLWLFGFIRLFRKSISLGLFFLAILLLSLAASSLLLYPFSGRLLLFYVPIAYLLCINTILDFSESIPFRRDLLLVISSCLMMGFLFIPSLLATVSPLNHSDIRTVIESIRDEKQPSDLLIVGYLSQSQYLYYREREQIRTLQVAVYMNKNTDADRIRQALCLKGESVRVWVLFGGAEPTRNGFIKSLDSLMRRLIIHRSDTAIAALYQFTPDTICN